jgi:preprotein translocase subunit YajC
MFVSQAFAQTAQTAVSGPSDTMGMMVQFVLIVLIVYFLLIRPQQKRVKQHEAELNAIIKGTKIIVAGIIGTVVEVHDNQELTVEVADGVRIRVMRPYVSQVIFETQTSKDKKKSK